MQNPEWEEIKGVLERILRWRIKEEGWRKMGRMCHKGEGLWYGNDSGEMKKYLDERQRSYGTDLWKWEGEEGVDAETCKQI